MSTNEFPVMTPTMIRMEREDAAHAMGAADYHLGLPRIMPLSDFLNADGTMDKAGAKAWYRGWDAANLADPS